MIAIDGDMVPQAPKSQINQVRKAIAPLLSFDLIEGRSESELKKILDVTHEVLLETLQAVANYVTIRFGSSGSSLTAQDVAELRKQTSQ
jgi:hypothetical protein